LALLHRKWYDMVVEFKSFVGKAIKFKQEGEKKGETKKESGPALGY